MKFVLDSSEDILAKYRSKHSGGASVSNTSVTSEAASTSEADSGVPYSQDINDQLNIHCEKFMFENAKKKLRIVLSNAEIQQLPCTSNTLHNLVSMFNLTRSLVEKILSILTRKRWL